jgi:FkbM family methyltransferase
MSLQMIETHSIVPDLVRSGGVVVDCGANLGAFSVEMIRRFACRCYGFESSPSVFRRMARHDNLYARNLAICGSDRTVELTVDDDITRSTIIPTVRSDASRVEVEGRHLGRLLLELGISEIEVLKMDIEGAEVEVIDSLPDKFFHKVGQLTIEFHDALGYSSRKEVVDRINRIINIGFLELYWSRCRNTGDVLLVNQRRMGPVRFFYEQEVVRRLRAARRRLLREFHWGTNGSSHEGGR